MNRCALRPLLLAYLICASLLCSCSRNVDEIIQKMKSTKYSGIVEMGVPQPSIDHCDWLLSDSENSKKLLLEVIQQTNEPKVLGYAFFCLGELKAYDQVRIAKERLLRLEECDDFKNGNSDAAFMWCQLTEYINQAEKVPVL